MPCAFLVLARDQVGGRLWAAVLVATMVFVASDFVRHPFSGGTVGRAATPARDLTLEVPGGDGRSAADGRTLARALSGPRHDARAGAGTGGAAAMVLRFAARPEIDGRRLLVLTSGMLAELQRGLRQPVTGEERAASAAALRALRRLRPVAPLRADAEVVAVRAGAAGGFDALAAGLRARPESRVIGIGADAASKARLAGLLSGLGVDGEVPYRVFPSGGDAMLALASGAVDLVLAPRSQTRSEVTRGTARVLAPAGPPTGAERAGPAGATPPAGPERAAPDRPAPAALAYGPGRPWSIVVGPPELDRSVRRALAARIGRAVRRPPWRRYTRRRGLRTLRPSGGGLAGFLAREGARASRLASIAARVPERGRRAR